MKQTTSGQKFSKLTYLKQIAGADITAAEYRVLIAVFNHTDADGRNAHPGNRLLASEANVSERTVERAIDRLRSDGWLVQDSRGSGYARQASVYRVAIPDTHVGLVAESTRQDGPTYPTSVTHIPDTGVGPSDPLTDPLSDGPPSADPSDPVSPSRVTGMGNGDCSDDGEQSLADPPLLRSAVRPHECACLDPQCQHRRGPSPAVASLDPTDPFSPAFVPLGERSQS